MLNLGLVGGVASGKSTVARLFEERGARGIDADSFAHQALEEPGIKQDLVSRWGPSILDDQGRIDRSTIADRIFSTAPEAREQKRHLESLVHPRVKERIQQERNALQKAGCQVAILDIPLLFEVGWEDECDLVAFVESSKSTRLARALGRGWTIDEWAQREASQLPMKEKRERATVVFRNDGSLAQLRRQVDQFWHVHIKSVGSQHQ